MLFLSACFGIGNSAYLTGLDAAGAAVSFPSYPTVEKWAQVILTFDGLAFLPVLTAVIVGARLTGSVQRNERPLNDHVIVVGLGNVGTRIVGQLHDLGVSVACVDKSESAAGIALARRLGLRVVIGETDQEETLRAAGIATCQALVSVTNSDIVNLETALLARSLAEDTRIVLRLSDEDLAGRVQRSIGNTISRSVPYLAAPSFALAMLEHQVLRTIPVGRHVLLIADLRVTPAPGSTARRWSRCTRPARCAPWPCSGPAAARSTGRRRAPFSSPRRTGSTSSPPGRGCRACWRASQVPRD